MSPQEREGLLPDELNELRADPAGYAKHLEARLPYFKDKVLSLPGKRSIQTEEGKAAVDEAIAVLKKTRPLPPLEPAYGLSVSARNHVRDIGPKGLVTHEGSGGTTSLEQRISRYAVRYNYLGEALSFGPDTPRDVVVDLVIDDAVADREHRELLLNPKFRHVGVACGKHAIYRAMCAIDLAAEYVGKP